MTRHFRRCRNREGLGTMGNLIEFLRVFFSYLMVFAVYVAIAAAGIFIGIKWRKSKDKKKVSEETAATAEQE